MSKKKLKFVYKLFMYTYTSHCQGTEDTGIGYALLHVPKTATFNNNRSTLYNKKNVSYSHEIELESIKDLTIEW